MAGREQDLTQDMCRQSMAREKLLDCMQYCWQNNFPLLVGKHTAEITTKLDTALENLQKGESTYLIITIPFRHGKSDIVSRYFPPYVFGRYPDLEIILSTYNQGLSNNMSRDARTIMKSEEYQKVFDTKLSPESHSVEQWAIDGKRGKLQAVGIEGGATGKGADILIIDDFLKNRADAESETTRNSQWNAFTGSLMTRLAPAHIVVVLATPWHVDDIIGRIHNRMKKGHKNYDVEFPKFETIKYPARSEKYESGYLFSERFKDSWYKKQFAVLGKYQSAALLQCTPTMRGGNMLKTENIDIIERNELPTGLRFVRFWDLASTEKEVAKDDPDFSSGALVATKKINDLEHVYVKDMRWVQAEAPKRNRLIETTAKADGARVEVGIESVAGYKDTYTTMKSILKGKRMVKKVPVSKDKVIRASDLEPIFEAGNFHMVRAWWNEPVIEQLSQFPNGTHDDHVDSIVGGYNQSKDLGMRAILA